MFAKEELPKPPEEFKSVNAFYLDVKDKVPNRRKHSLILPTAATMGLLERLEVKETGKKRVHINYRRVEPLTKEKANEVAIQVNKILSPNKSR